MATQLKKELNRRELNRVDMLKTNALNSAIDYHRSFCNGAAVAAAQKGREIPQANSRDVVVTAKAFFAFLSGTASEDDKKVPVTPTQRAIRDLKQQSPDKSREPVKPEARL